MKIYRVFVGCYPTLRVLLHLLRRCFGMALGVKTPSQEVRTGPLGEDSK